MMDVVETLAAACHCAYIAYAVHCLGEVSPPWDELDEDRKESTRNGVEFLLKSYQSGVSRVQLYRSSHENWLEHMQKNGWKYGPRLMRDRKVHPNIVPYDHLHMKQVKKDSIFVDTFIQMVEVLGIKIEKPEEKKGKDGKGDAE